MGNTTVNVEQNPPSLILSLPHTPVQPQPGISLVHLHP